MMYNLNKEIYNKKSIPINSKFRDYLIVIRLEPLYAAQCLALTKKQWWKNWKLKTQKY